MLNLDYNTIKAEAIIRLNPVQTAVSAKIVAKDEIEKIITAYAEAVINNYNVAGSYLAFSGKVNYKLLALLTDGQVIGLAYNADFSDKVLLPTGSVQPQAYFDCVVLNNDFELSGSTVALTTLIDTSTNMIVAKQHQCLTASDNACVKKNSIDLCNDTTIKKLNATITSEVELPSSVTKMLCAESYINITDSFIDEAVLTIVGETTLNLTYLTKDNELTSSLVSSPFTQEVDVDIDAKDSLISCVKIKGSKIHLDIVEEDDNNALTAEIQAEFVLMSNKVVQQEVIEDIYSKSHQLTIDKEQIVNTIIQGRYDYDFVVNEEVDLPEGNSRIISLINCRVDIVKLSSLEGEIVFDGILQGCLLYKGEKVGGANFELPFTKSVADTNLSSQVNLSCCANVVNIKYNASRKLAIEAIIKAEVVATQDKTQNIICKVEEGEEITISQHAFEVCLAKKGDSLWNTAKNLNMTEQEIAETNPDLEFPLKEDQQVVIYHQIKAINKAL
ncbi:MAG: hypothetical protein RR248_04910 [Clostridia bacterium]